MKYRIFVTMTITIVMTLLAGCVSNDLKEGSVPPMLFYPVNQSRVIVIQGVESGLDWSSFSYKVSSDDEKDPCNIKAPTSGEIQPGQVIHILTDNAITQCIISVYYKEIQLGTYTFNQQSERIDEKTQEAIAAASAANTTGTTDTNTTEEPK